MQRISKLFCQALNIPSQEIASITFLGGMTNKNYLISLDQKNQFVMRIPGAMTESLISRDNEENNSHLTSAYHFNVQTCYFDSQSGIKITRYLQDSQALNHENIREPQYLEAIAKHLKALHTSDILFENEFNVFMLYDQYLKLLKNPQSFYRFHIDMEELLSFFEQIRQYFSQLKRPLVPCHNDLVPENILVQGDTKKQIYFIDWEYSGMNDLLFDLAAFLLESKLNDTEKTFFLSAYFQTHHVEQEYNLILLYQFTQGILWTLWTIIKEEHHEYFGNYGQKRIQETLLLMQKIKTLRIL